VPQGLNPKNLKKPKIGFPAGAPYLDNARNPN
jgi:hypothetical protein